MGEFFNVLVVDEPISVVVDEMEVGINVHRILGVLIGAFYPSLELTKTHYIFRVVLVFVLTSNSIASELILLVSRGLFQGCCQLPS